MQKKVLVALLEILRKIHLKIRNKNLIILNLA